MREYEREFLRELAKALVFWFFVALFLIVTGTMLATAF